MLSLQCTVLHTNVNMNIHNEMEYSFISRLNFLVIYTLKINFILRFDCNCFFSFICIINNKRLKEMVIPKYGGLQT